MVGWCNAHRELAQRAGEQNYNTPDVSVGLQNASPHPDPHPDPHPNPTANPNPNLTLTLTLNLTLTLPLTLTCVIPFFTSKAPFLSVLSFSASSPGVGAGVGGG